MGSMTTRISQSLWVCLLGLGACAGATHHVASVARTDLACDQLTIAKIADNRYAASGCGRGGVYSKMCGNGHGCEWVRLESATAHRETTGAYANTPPTNGPREVIQAPPPEQRQVIQAPPPAQREIIQAPPPDGQAPGQPPPNAYPTYDPQSQQPVPLSQGDLSAPYEAQIPLAPTAQRSEYPPPAPLEEDRPPPPNPGYQWVPGYWSWGSSNWLWAPGYWTAPMVGYSYVPGSWYWANNYWWYGPGGWARPGATYISIGVQPRPHGYGYTRSFRPHGGYTPPPTRLGAGPVHANGPAPAARSGFVPQASPLYRYPAGHAGSNVGAARMGAAPAQHGSFSTWNSNPTYGNSSSSSFGAASHSPAARVGSSPSFGSPSPSSSFGAASHAPAARAGSSPAFGSPSPSHHFGAASAGSAPVGARPPQMSGPSVHTMPSHTPAPAMRGPAMHHFNARPR